MEIHDEDEEESGDVTGAGDKCDGDGDDEHDEMEEEEDDRDDIELLKFAF